MSLRWNSTITGQILSTDLIKSGEVPSLEALLESVQGQTATLVVSNQIIVRDSITIPYNIAVVISRSGLLDIQSGVTLEIDGSILAGAYSIFTGTGDPVINGNSNPIIYPEWFSTASDGSYSGTEITKATNSIKSGTTAYVFVANSILGGLLAYSRVNVISNYTILETNNIVGCNQSAAVDLTLPSSTGLTIGSNWIIKDESGAASTNNITISPNSIPGTDTIDGASSLSITVNDSSVNLYYGGNGKFYVW